MSLPLIDVTKHFPRRTDMVDELEISESAVRSRAKRLGYAVRKSRRGLSLDNHGGYQIVDVNLNGVAAGSRFELTLEDCAEWLHGDE